MFDVGYQAYRRTWVTKNVQSEDEARNLAHIMCRQYGAAWFASDDKHESFVYDAGEVVKLP